MKRLSRIQRADLLVQAIAVVLGIAIIFPIIFCFCTALKGPYDILSKPPTLLPKAIDFENFLYVFRYTTINTYLLNSMFIAIAASVIRIITASMAAFAFAFMEFRGKRLFFFLILGTMMIPADATMITNYMTVSGLKMINSYLGIMIVYFVNAMNVFMLRQHFLTVSQSLREASYIDGCGNVRFFSTILIPVSKSVLTTVFISSFISMWNIYMWPMLVTNVNEMRTVQVAITMLSSSDNAATDGPTMAASLIILLPTVLLFLLFRNQIVEGVSAGAVKG